MAVDSLIPLRCDLYHFSYHFSFDPNLTAGRTIHSWEAPSLRGAGLDLLEGEPTEQFLFY